MKEKLEAAIKHEIASCEADIAYAKKTNNERMEVQCKTEKKTWERALEMVSSI